MPKLQNAEAAGTPVAIETRIPNAAMAAPETLEGIRKLLVGIQKGGLPAGTLELTHMRASQINGCSSCIEGAIRHAHKSGALDDRMLAVAAWHHASRFTAAERAALELTEEMTRLADRQDPVPDEVWGRVADHYDERARAALVLYIALTNLFNRLNVATRQPAGDW